MLYFEQVIHKEEMMGKAENQQQMEASLEQVQEALRRSEARNDRLCRLLYTATRINKLLVQMTEPRQLLEETCCALVETQAFRLAWIGLVEEETPFVRPLAQAGFEPGYLESVTITRDDSPTGRGPTGTAIRTGESSVSNDIEQDPRMASWRQEARRFGYRSSAAIPLRRADRVVGALNVYAGEPDAFDEDLLRLLQGLADNIAFGLEKITSDATIQAQLAELQARERLVEALLGAFDLDERLDVALREVTALVDAEMGVIYLVKGDRLVVRRQSGVPDALLAPIRDLPLDAVVWRERLVLSWEDEPRIPVSLTETMRREGVRGWIWVPMKAKGRLLGVFLLGSSRPRPFSGEQVRTLVALSDLVAATLQQARLYRQARERLARLTMLREIDRAISATLSLDEITDIVLQKALPDIPVDAVGISLIDRERKRTILAHVHLPEGGHIDEDAFVLADGLLDQLMVGQESVVIYDVQADPRVQNYRHVIHRYNLRSYVGVPLVVQDEAVGVLHLLTTQPCVFREEDLQFFKTLAGQTAISFQNAWLYEEAVQRYGGMRALADLTLELQTRGYQEVLASRVLDVACQITGATIGAFFGYDGAARSLRLVGVVGLPASESRWVKGELCFSLGEERGLAGLVAYMREPLYLTDVQGDPRWISPDVPVRSVYWVPLFHGERLFGVYSLASTEVDGFSREQRVLADTLGSYVSTALENAHLFQETHRAYEELKSTQAQLLQAQKLEAIGALAGGVAHDFNNHLAVIRLYADLALRDLPLDSPFRSRLEEIRKATEHSANLTRQLLLFSRRQPMERKPLSLNVIVQDMEKMLGRLLGEDIRLDILLQEDLWPVNADAGSLQQVLMNLAVNARDAMLEGGRLAIETGNEVLTEAHRHPKARPGRFVRLTVRDTGVGMDETVKAHLFEPFFTTKERGKGTGLGLSVVYGIVQAHEGWIEVESEVGRGSTFVVYLPALDLGGETWEEVGSEAAVPRGQGEYILLVEDAEALLEATVATLEESGYRVYACGMVKEALEVFEQERERFDLVIADVVLPDGRGTLLVERLLEQQPGLAVLLVSGYSDGRSDWVSIRQRGIPFLQKPFTGESLLSTVRELLQSSTDSAS